MLLSASFMNDLGTVCLSSLFIYAYPMLHLYIFISEETDTFRYAPDGMIWFLFVIMIYYKYLFLSYYLFMGSEI